MVVEIPATESDDETRSFTLLKTFSVIDDNVNEIEQSFALIAELGNVPESFVCFQRQVGDTECFGRRGATEIKIVDNDCK